MIQSELFSTTFIQKPLTHQQMTANSPSGEPKLLNYLDSFLEDAIQPLISPDSQINTSKNIQPSSQNKI